VDYVLAQHERNNSLRSSINDYVPARHEQNRSTINDYVRVEQEHSHLSLIDEDFYARIEQEHSSPLSNLSPTSYRSRRIITLVLSKNIVHLCRSCRRLVVNQRGLLRSC